MIGRYVTVIASGSTKDEGEVGGLAFAEGGRDADEEGILGGQEVEVGGGSQGAGADYAGKVGVGDIDEIGPPVLHRADALRVDIEAGDGEAGAGEFEGLGEADVAETEHAHPGGTRHDALAQGARCVHAVLGSWAGFSWRVRTLAFCGATSCS